MKTTKGQAKLAYNRCADTWHASRQIIPTLNEMNDLMKQNRPHYFVEKPAMKRLLPNLKGKKVLCVGCGSGEEVAMIEKKHPNEITGIDIAEKLIKITQHDYPRHKFIAMDLESLLFEDTSFDFIYGSLVFHYFKSWKRLLGEIYRVLKPGGTLQFSSIHPAKWSAHREYFEHNGRPKDIKIGASFSHDGKNQQVFGDYLNTVTLHETWVNKISLTFYSRPISAMVNDIITAGFTIKMMVEPKPTEETKLYDPDYYKLGSKIPSQVIFVCEKKR